MDEKSWVDGNTAAWLSMLGHCLAQLGTKAPNAAKLVAEREAAVAKLREVCETHGDNDWPRTLHLADVIEKHLARHLG